MTEPTIIDDASLNLVQEELIRLVQQPVVRFRFAGGSYIEMRDRDGRCVWFRTRRPEEDPPIKDLFRRAAEEIHALQTRSRPEPPARKSDAPLLAAIGRLGRNQ